MERAIWDLSEAVWGRAPYLGNIDRDRRHWGEYANNLGVALFEAYRSFDNVKALNNAVEYLRYAEEALPDDTPARARTLANLMAIVEVRQAVKGREIALPDLTELRRKLSAVTSAPTTDRLAAARSWGYAAAEAEGPEAGYDGLATATDLLPRAAWWGLPRDTREQIIADYNGLATDAAGCAIAAGEHRRALELLDGGRAVLWTQQLTTRTDRTALHAVAPRLAKRMDRVANALEKDTDMPAGRRMALAHRWSRLDKKATAKLHAEWESLARRARAANPEGTYTIPNYANDLSPAGDEGPVVVINISRWRCDALIVQEGYDEPRLVELPDLTYDDAHDRAAAYMTALTGSGNEPREQIICATLDWLWRVLASPILTALGLPEPNGDSAEPAKIAPPRLWWCPTGPLATLPLHAAAPASPNDGDVLDQAVSSYTPTLRVLVLARNQRDVGQGTGNDTDSDTDRRLLHVAAGDDPDRESLPGAARTRAYLEQVLPADRRTTLDGTAATHQAVRAALDQHAWAHFDCHGEQDLDNPFQGGLILHDQPLTVADVAGIRRDQAEFAFLAACATAVGGSRIPDEAITLTAALQYAGYQSVIGTLWSVPDRAAARITQSVYGTLATSGTLRTADAAGALHEAVRAERARYPHHPSAWVPFLHVGR